MPAVDNAPERGVADAVDHLPHELITPLTTISGRTQLLARAIWRSPRLVDEERVAMLGSITAIETGIETLRAVIDRLGMGIEDPNSAKGPRFVLCGTHPCVRQSACGALQCWGAEH